MGRQIYLKVVGPVAEDVIKGWMPVYPHIRYDDPNQAVAWLSRVFGFRERVRLAQPDATVIASKLEAPGGGLVMVARLSPEFKQWVRERVPNFRDQPERPWQREAARAVERC